MLILNILIATSVKVRNITSSCSALRKLRENGKIQMNMLKKGFGNIRKLFWLQFGLLSVSYSFLKRVQQPSLRVGHCEAYITRVPNRAREASGEQVHFGVRLDFRI